MLRVTITSLNVRVNKSYFGPNLFYPGDGQSGFKVGKHDFKYMRSGLTFGKKNNHHIHISMLTNADHMNQNVRSITETNPRSALDGMRGDGYWFICMPFDRFNKSFDTGRRSRLAGGVSCVE